MQIDIGFGDAVYPEPEFADFPVFLPMAVPHIRAYPKESVIAEKLHAMVELGIRNTRMKDFYVIWFMASNWEFDLTILQAAIRASLERRGTSAPETIPFALTESFAKNPQKQVQWGAFIQRVESNQAPPLEQVGFLLRTFFDPCFTKQKGTRDLRWTEAQDWKSV